MAIIADSKEFLPKVSIDSIQSRATATHESMFVGEGPIDYFLFQLQDPDKLPLPAWWSRQRDMFLRQCVRRSSILGSVNWGRVSQIKNTEWRIEAVDKRAAPLLPKYHDLFTSSQFGNGFRTFLELYTQDTYCQDNGAFIEFIGPGEEHHLIDHTGSPVIAKMRLPKDRIEGFAHLDAAQCWRTYNPQFPVIYTDPWTGQRHILHWSRVNAKAQFQQSIERGRGIGLCAVSRAFLFAEIAQASDDYIYEKMTGQSPEVAIVTGVPIHAIRDALHASKIDNDAKGRVKYKGMTFIGGDNAPNVTPGITKAGIKDTPDGWDRTKEYNLAMHLLAVAYATDVRDLGFPAQSMGQTKADAEIQDLKTSGRGRSDVLRDMEEIVNSRLLPPGLQFVFDRKDDLEDKRKCEITKIRVDTRDVQIKNGELSVDEARTMAAKEGDIDPAFVSDEVVVEDEGNPIEGETVSPVEEKKTLIASKNYDSLRTRFTKQMFSAVNHLRKSGNVSEFFQSSSAIIKSFGQRAYLYGVQDGGAPGIRSVGKLEPEEQSEMNVLVNDQIGFLSNLSNSVLDGDIKKYADIRSRVELWANKGLDGIYNAGKLAGAANANMLWVLGKTEQHCEDCLRLAGRIYRARTWKRYGIQPRAPELSCGGWRCDCHLEQTSERVTPGRPPKLHGS